MTWGSWGSWGYSSSADNEPEPRRKASVLPRSPTCMDCGRPIDPRAQHHCLRERRAGPPMEEDHDHDCSPVDRDDEVYSGRPYHREYGEPDDQRAYREKGDRHRKRPRPPHGDRRVHIKTLVVIAEERVQKVGAFTIEAPVGVGTDSTGKLTHPIRLEPIGDPVLGSTVIENKLINEGFVRAKLIVDDTDPNPCADARKFVPQVVTIPFQTVHDIPGIRPGDHIQEFSKIEALLVSGTPVPCPPGASGSAVTLRLKIVLQVSVVIARECIIAVPAEVLRCMPPDQTPV